MDKPGKELTAIPGALCRLQEVARDHPNYTTSLMHEAINECVRPPACQLSPPPLRASVFLPMPGAGALAQQPVPAMRVNAQFERPFRLTSSSAPVRRQRCPLCLARCPVGPGGHGM